MIDTEFLITVFLTVSIEWPLSGLTSYIIHHYIDVTAFTAHLQVTSKDVPIQTFVGLQCLTVSQHENVIRFFVVKCYWSFF